MDTDSNSERCSNRDDQQMTAKEAETTTAPAEAINGFVDLYPRQVTPHKTVVLSLRNDGPTAHVVDIAALTCDCADQEHNQPETGICDHLAVALFEARKEYSIEQGLVTDLSRTLSEMRDISGQLQQAGTTTGNGAGGSGVTQSQSESGDDSTDSSGGVQTGDASAMGLTEEVESVEEWLKNWSTVKSDFNHALTTVSSGTVDGEKAILIDFVEPWNHPGSVWDSSSNAWESDEKKEEYMAGKEAFRDVMKSADGVEYLGEPDYQNYIPADAVGEVVG